MNLLELKDALMEDSSWQRESAIMRKEFVKVTSFQETFYERLFMKFTDCIRSAKHDT